MDITHDPATGISTGDRIGKLVVESMEYAKSNQRVRCHVRCTCGRTETVDAASLAPRRPTAACTRCRDPWLDQRVGDIHIVDRHSSASYIAICSKCSQEITVTQKSLRAADPDVIHCDGASKHEPAGRQKWKDITGQVYGQLTVIERAGNDRWQQVMWRCRCTCGREVIVRGGQLRYGRTKRCRQCANERQRKYHMLYVGCQIGSLKIIQQGERDKHQWIVHCNKCKRTYNTTDRWLRTLPECRYCTSKYAYQVGQTIGPYRILEVPPFPGARHRYHVVCTQCNTEHKVSGTVLRRWTHRVQHTDSPACPACHRPRRKRPRFDAGDQVGIYSVLQRITQDGKDVCKVQCTRCGTTHIRSHRSLYQHMQIECQRCPACRNS